MYALFEDGGKFLAGRLMSEADSSMQVELDSGKRVKVKSANVLLRPVVEAQLMPTVAYVAGPGEIAYFSQVSAVAKSLGVPVPLAVPRWSGMIVPADVDATLSRFGATLDELRAPHALEQRLARAALPPAAQASLTKLRTAVDDAMAGLDGLLTQAALEARARLHRHLDVSQDRFPLIWQGGAHGLRLVRKERLELSRVAPQEPKSCASTSSATFALGAALRRRTAIITNGQWPPGRDTGADQ